MGEIVKVKHLIYTIGCMIVFAFGLGANVNSKLIQVYTNKTDITELKKNEKEIKSIIRQNHTEVMNGFAELKLELKLELKDKQNRKD